MKRTGITFKIFIVTGILLVVSAMMAYFVLYFILPSYYLHEKKTRLQAGVDSLVESLQQTPHEEADRLLDRFVSRFNVPVVIQDKKNTTVYFANSVYGMLSKDTISKEVLLSGDAEESTLLENYLRTSGDISISRNVTFQRDPQVYRLTVFSTIQPIDEAARVILRFLPYMLVAIILISIAGAYVYSRLIARPLLRLNHRAKRMAELVFSAEPPIRSNDELGELSGSLDKLARNLQISMDELKDANSRLKDDIQKEREQEAGRREFIATISHELKTPITAVLGQTEGMIHGIGAYRDRDKYLRESYRIMKGMDRLVHEILELSRLDSFQFTPRLQTVDLSALVSELLESFRCQGEQSGIQWTTDIDPELRIQADEKLLSKAVANVIGNAVKYTGTGEKVAVSLKSADRNIRLEIANSGSHIDEEELERVFQPFYRIEKSRSRRTGGSGLGLYIVRRILEMHRVAYSLRNSPEGVVFRMDFDQA